MDSILSHTHTHTHIYIYITKNTFVSIRDFEDSIGYTNEQS